jgi:hypothetical protein
MNENTEELIFKGMRQLRYKRQDVMLRDALRSPYYWWWAFLRLSKDYWWVCYRRGAVGDLRLKEMYRDFGNVYELTFEEWFLKRGKNLLREELALPEVRKLSPSNLELSQPVERHLILEIPLNMTEKNIISQVRRQLRIHPEREVERISTAKRKLAKLIGMRQDVIESAYAVAIDEGSEVLVERHIVGDEHRLLVVGNKLVAAAKGETVWVTGDGKHTVHELIQIQIN